MTKKLLMHGDCLEKMKEIDDGSVDLILTDPPYGTTECKWDSVIPFDPMWEQIWRVLKHNGWCLFFSLDPFTAKLICSQLEYFKYNWIWHKNRIGQFAQAKHRPLLNYETIVVFSRTGLSHGSKVVGTYNPQGVKLRDKPSKRTHSSETFKPGRKEGRYISYHTNYPKTVLKIECKENKSFHPTQKPVELLEYLIKTYTNKNETVLDFTMGSGSTGVACANLSRDFIGIELDEKYFEIAKERLGMKEFG